MTSPRVDIDPLEQLRALRTTAPASATASDDPLEQLKATRANTSTSSTQPDIHAEFRSGRLAKRIQRENTNDREQLDAEPSYGQRLATHILNTAQGIPGVERVEAAAGSVGSKFTDHSMDYDESLNTLRGETSKIGGKTSMLEHAMGSVAIAPFLRGGIVAQGAELGGADELASADHESVGERAINTITGAGKGAALALALRGAGAVGSRVLSRIPGGVSSNLQVHGVEPVAPNLERASAIGATAVTDEQRARDMLAKTLRDGGVSPSAAAATVPLDQPTSMLELGSRNTASLVRAARNVPTSTAGQTTDRFITERAAGTGKRIESALSEATGHTATDTWQPVEQIVAKRSAQAKPLYEEAYAHGEIQDPETVAKVQELLREPVFARAWRRGEALARIEGSKVAEAPPRGIDPASWRALSQAKAGDVEGDLFVPNAPAQKANPTVRQLDRWKKGLDAVIESGHGSENALSKDEARVYRGALNEVLNRVDAEVPKYGEARANFRGNSEMMEAAEAGAQHFSPSVPTGALERQFAALPDAEREAYRANALNKVVENIRTAATNEHLPEAGRDANIVQRLMGSEDAGQRLGMLFPDEASFQNFLKRMEDEALYPKTNKFLRQQSSTNAQQLESGTSPAEWMGSAVDAVRHPMRTIGKAISKRAGMAPATADEVARQATATGTRLKGILQQMDADRAARELGRKRLNNAMRTTLIGAEQGVYGYPHPARSPEDQ